MLYADWDRCWTTRDEQSEERRSMQGLHGERFSGFDFKGLTDVSIGTYTMDRISWLCKLG